MWCWGAGCWRFEVVQARYWTMRFDVHLSPPAYMSRFEETRGSRASYLSDWVSKASCWRDPLCVSARGSSSWNGSIGFKGSYIHVPSAGQSKDPGLGFGQTECLKPVTGRIYSLYNYLFPTNWPSPWSARVGNRMRCCLSLHRCCVFSPHWFVWIPCGLHMRVPTGNTLPVLLLARPGVMGLWQLHLYKLKDLGAPWQAIQVQSIVFLECSPQESVAHNSRAQQAEGSFKLDQNIKFEE